MSKIVRLLLFGTSVTALALPVLRFLQKRRQGQEELVTASGQPIRDDALLTDVDASITPERQPRP